MTGIWEHIIEKMGNHELSEKQKESLGSFHDQPSKALEESTQSASEEGLNRTQHRNHHAN